MPPLKIIFINLGYARGIDGSLSQHLLRGHRHFYCPPAVQNVALGQLQRLIEAEAPDLCCLVEIDGGAGPRPFNQLHALRSAAYPFGDIENKYGEKSFLRSFPLTAGKSNGFIARADYAFEKLYFRHGVKRLVYKIGLPGDLVLLFAHFSLKKQVRARQIIEMRDLARAIAGPLVLLGDFNTLDGVQEIDPLLRDGRLRLLNPWGVPTFFFNRKTRVLDLCLCSTSLSENAHLKIVPQPYTDHAALILEISA